MPKLTVIMPVYNAEAYLREAIESVLSQTFSDFEFLIINDGSSDNSSKIIQSFNDPRIHFVLREHLGLVSTLNYGLSLAAGEYIARMDADDLSLPDRFASQIEFLDHNPDYGLVGSAYFRLNQKREITSVAPVLFEDIDLRNQLLLKNPFGHGTVMIRFSIIKKFQLAYRQAAKHYEDYDLWIRISEATKFKNLPQALYCWMENPNGVTTVFNKVIAEGTRDLIKKHFEEIKKVRFSFADIRQYYGRSFPYRRKYIMFQGKKYATNFLSEFQYYLFSLGLFNLKRGEFFGGVMLLLMSIVIHPQTYLKQFFKIPAAGIQHHIN